MFLGMNLQKVRTLFGYSRKDLGEALGISEQAVWQFENQMTSPSFETILSLKKIFGVKTSYFYQCSSSEKLFQEEKIAYREPDMISRKKTVAEAEYLNTVAPIISKLESCLNVPSAAIEPLKEEILKKYYKYEKITRVEVQEIAEMVRAGLSISENNSNLLYQIEKSGIHVVEKNVGGKADAYSSWSIDGKTPYIVLGKKKSAVRRNFDLAHELGHLLMHFNQEFLTLDKKDYKRLETEADLFASFFLLPEKSFLKDFSQIKHVSNPSSYIGMKIKYNVSIQTLVLRAFRLGLISPSQLSYFYRILTKSGYREQEPLDEEIVLKRPGKIRNIMQLVFSNELLSLAEFQEQLHVETAYLEKLFSIEDSFFEQFQKRESFSSHKKVISIQLD